ncbi:glucose/galactose MFS transporter [Sphingomonas sp.]|uniref:glucose/galactose MFS transporter n=1 Tax=Sphingomonas sp. TaxID=28214 RepID=UPI001EB100AB|nr:glucose/galactose MFS transporter [Sphingomonas sp.]MBX3594814.1 glucose/galactose MFS transporter [Sphingomonas sp.]
MADTAPPVVAPASGTLAAYCTVTTLFFAWGFITSLVDPLVAAVKGIFELSDVEAQLSASAFFIAYGVMSFPSAVLLARMRAANTIVLALGMMLAGCVVMLAAANAAVYGLVLLGLFVLASGITVLQVAANPLASILGPPHRSHLRLTLAQALNSLGTFIGPYLGAALFLQQIEIRHDAVVTDAARDAALGGIDRAFFWIAGLLLALIVFFATTRGLIRRATDAHDADGGERAGMFALLSEAIASRWTLFGGLAIFCYVGAEVAIGTQMAFFLSGPDVFDMPLQQAAKMVSLYWGGAMVGRLLGSAVLTRVPAGRVLLFASIAACLICIHIFTIGGSTAGYAALCIGLMNSVMFPVIFTLTLERSTARPAATSGFLCFSIVGGAAMPPLTGLVSGMAGYAAAFVVPALCYAVVAGFAALAARAGVRRPIDPGLSPAH